MRRPTKKIFCIGLALFFVYIFVLLNNNAVIEVSDLSFTELQTCPACFGTTLCSHYQFQQLKLNGWSHFKALQLFNAKNIFFGQLGYEDVVVKKLAHDEELARVDAGLCSRSGLGRACNITKAVRVISDRLEKLPKESLPGEMEKLFSSDLFRCPSQRLIDLMYRRCLDEPGMVVVDPNIAKQNLIFTAMTNPEPLILQMFPSSEGWPFPRLLGSCGRTIVVEHGGQMLSDMVDDPWRKRAEIGIQLLRLAQQLTENAVDYALYLTDVNLHNFAVDKEGVLRLIDVENVIVVDKQKVRKDKQEGWDEPYINRGVGCNDCLSFSTSDLCNHEISDHNYYAICRGILAPHAYYCRSGFLHDIPQSALLNDLLEKCAHPTKDTMRLEIVPKLVDLLESLVY